MGKFLNIYFYNFFLLSRFFSKLLVIYLNPFVWVENFSKIKLGKKIFSEHMEKNYPTFLHQYKYIYKLKIQFIPFLALVNLIVIALLFFFLNINISKYYVIILIISFLLSLVQSYVFVFDNDKYQTYFKEFYLTKKYDYPFVTFLFISTFLFLWLYNVFFNVLN